MSPIDDLAGSRRILCRTSASRSEPRLNPGRLRLISLHLFPKTHIFMPVQEPKCDLTLILRSDGKLPILPLGKAACLHQEVVAKHRRQACRASRPCSIVLAQHALRTNPQGRIRGDAFRRRSLYARGPFRHRLLRAHQPLGIAARRNRA